MARKPTPPPSPKSSPLAAMMASAVQPTKPTPFIKGVATPPPQKATPGKAPGGPGRGNLANFKGKHAPPFKPKGLR